MSGSTMKLFSKSVVPKAGSTSQPIVFLHGLLGSHMNLRTPATKLGNALGSTIHLLDMPHHGKSIMPAIEGSMLYSDMAKSVLRWMDSEGIDSAHVVGHSMGGKTAMAMALAEPERIQSALVVDIAPVDYNQNSGFALNTTIVDSLRKIPLQDLSSRQEAEEMLAETVAEAGIRNFVLMNLESKSDGSFGWKVNLDAIATSLPTLASWEREEHASDSYLGPTTFIGGANSGYIQPDYHDAMLASFPAAQVTMVPKAGHWIHAENPTKFHELGLEHFQALP